jgi:hypothetical protein
MVKKGEQSLLLGPETASGHAEDMKPHISCQDNNAPNREKEILHFGSLDFVRGNQKGRDELPPLCRLRSYSKTSI